MGEQPGVRNFNGSIISFLDRFPFHALASLGQRINQLERSDRLDWIVIGFYMLLCGKLKPGIIAPLTMQAARPWFSLSYTILGE